MKCIVLGSESRCRGRSRERKKAKPTPLGREQCRKAMKDISVG
jgi:hypothetical protein